MKITIISDTHLQCQGMRFPDADVLIHAGDHTMRGSMGELDAAGQWLAGFRGTYRHIIAIPGNHDFEVQAHPTFWVHRWRDQYGIELLIDRAITYDGVTFYGSPWQPWFHDYAYNLPLLEPETAVAIWARIPDDTNVLITHGPPRGILDQTFGGWDTRVGCPHLLERVRQLKHLSLHAFGHIHEANGIEEHDGVLFVNAATCDRRRYSPQQPGYVVETDPCSSVDAA